MIRKILIDFKNLLIARASARPRSKKFQIAVVLLAFSTLPSQNAFSADKTIDSAIKNIRMEKIDICLPAIESLGRSKSPQAARAIVSAYDGEKRPLVRRYMVDTLGRIQSPIGRPTLIKALRDSDEQIRQSAVVALSSLGGSESDAALVSHAQIEQASPVKNYLAQALGRSKHPEATARLKLLAQDKDAGVQRLAQEGLRQHKEKGRK